MPEVDNYLKFELAMKAHGWLKGALVIGVLDLMSSRCDRDGEHFMHMLQHFEVPFAHLVPLPAPVYNVVGVAKSAFLIFGYCCLRVYGSQQSTHGPVKLGVKRSELDCWGVESHSARARLMDLLPDFAKPPLHKPPFVIFYVPSADPQADVFAYVPCNLQVHDWKFKLADEEQLARAYASCPLRGDVYGRFRDIVACGEQMVFQVVDQIFACPDKSWQGPRTTSEVLYSIRCRLGLRFYHKGEGRQFVIAIWKAVMEHLVCDVKLEAGRHSLGFCDLGMSQFINQRWLRAHKQVGFVGISPIRSGPGVYAFVPSVDLYHQEVFKQSDGVFIVNGVTFTTRVRDTGVYSARMLGTGESGFANANDVMEAAYSSTPGAVRLRGTANQVADKLGQGCHPPAQWLTLAGDTRKTVLDKKTPDEIFRLVARVLQVPFKDEKVYTAKPVQPDLADVAAAAGKRWMAVTARPPPRVGGFVTQHRPYRGFDPAAVHLVRRAGYAFGQNPPPDGSCGFAAIGYCIIDQQSGDHLSSQDVRKIVAGFLTDETAKEFHERLEQVNVALTHDEGEEYEKNRPAIEKALGREMPSKPPIETRIDRLYKRHRRGRRTELAVAQNMIMDKDCWMDEGLASMAAEALGVKINLVKVISQTVGKRKEPKVHVTSLGHGEMEVDLCIDDVANNHFQTLYKVWPTANPDIFEPYHDANAGGGQASGPSGRYAVEATRPSDVAPDADDVVIVYDGKSRSGTVSSADGGLLRIRYRGEAVTTMVDPTKVRVTVFNGGAAEAEDMCETLNAALPRQPKAAKAASYENLRGKFSMEPDPDDSKVLHKTWRVKLSAGLPKSPRDFVSTRRVLDGHDARLVAEVDEEDNPTGKVVVPAPPEVALMAPTLNETDVMWSIRSKEADIKARTPSTANQVWHIGGALRGGARAAGPAFVDAQPPSWFLTGGGGEGTGSIRARLSGAIGEVWRVPGVWEALLREKGPAETCYVEEEVAEHSDIFLDKVPVLLRTAVQLGEKLWLVSDGSVRESTKGKPPRGGILGTTAVKVDLFLGMEGSGSESDRGYIELHHDTGGYVGGAVRESSMRLVLLGKSTAFVASTDFAVVARRAGGWFAHFLPNHVRYVLSAMADQPAAKRRRGVGGGDREKEYLAAAVAAAEEACSLANVSL